MTLTAPIKWAAILLVPACYLATTALRAAQQDLQFAQRAVGMEFLPFLRHVMMGH